MTNYKYFIVQTYKNLGEPSSKKVRVRAIPGQGVATDRNVECSEGMRLAHPVGSHFKVKCKVTDREGGKPFLYRHFKWDYELVSAEEAQKFIQSNFT